MMFLTEEELLHLNLPNKRTELVRGKLIVREPAGFRHGVVAGRLYEAITRHVTSSGLGVVVAAETGFTLFRDPDTVRAPDVGFVARERVPDPLPRGFAALAPDLAVEVLSPDDRAGDVLEKVADWIQAGCRLVWVVDPERRLARVYRRDGSEAMIGADDSLGGEDVLPGFACPLTTIV
ncbi:MAG: Uma2 family endonuclease [Gemmatimonadaceae bacterium]